MAKNLLIVESPAKATTINRYLGPDFKVLASYGHVRDFPLQAFKGLADLDLAVPAAARQRLDRMVRENAERSLRALDFLRAHGA